MTEKILLNSIILHEAHKKTKIKCKVKWAMVVNDLFQHPAFKGFIPVQSDSLARKFKRIKKDFEDKFEGPNPADFDRMSEVEELVYAIRKDELAGKLSLTRSFLHIEYFLSYLLSSDMHNSNGMMLVKPRKSRSSQGHLRNLLSDHYSSEGNIDFNQVSGHSEEGMVSPTKIIQDTVKDVLSSMLSLEGDGEGGGENPTKKLKLDDSDRERLLRLESELGATKTQDRMAKTIADLYQDNRDLREEIKRLQKEVEELKRGATTTTL